MAAPSMVFTARYVAKHLGVDLAVIEELAEDMAPEDGRLSVEDYDELSDKERLKIIKAYEANEELRFEEGTS